MGDREATLDEEFHGFVTSRRPRLMRTAYLLAGERHSSSRLWSGRTRRGAG
ncbi:hypothetical protein ACFWYW_43560 [Nonomuraea sp. NPDC059023]|uniref:hypothetical protein n=1 Tax=unclassified Nonomuraea TaxID=2593643 RepID=UPI003678FC2E